MGRDLQGRYDDGGGDRPAGASLRHHRAEYSEVSSGGSQEEATCGKPGRRRVMRRVARQKTEREKSCGNACAVESVESQNQASHSFHEPLGNLTKSRRDSHISTAPATMAD